MAFRAAANAASRSERLGCLASAGCASLATARAQRGGALKRAAANAAKPERAAGLLGERSMREPSNSPSAARRRVEARGRERREQVEQFALATCLEGHVARIARR